MKKASPGRPSDELRAEYDLAELKGGVRGKYLSQTATSANPPGRKTETGGTVTLRSSRSEELEQPLAAGSIVALSFARRRIEKKTYREDSAPGFTGALTSRFNSIVFSLWGRRDPTSQVSAIQVGTPKRGKTNFISRK